MDSGRLLPPQLSRSLTFSSRPTPVAPGGTDGQFQGASFQSQRLGSVTTSWCSKMSTLSIAFATQLTIASLA